MNLNSPLLEIKNLQVLINDTKILKKLNLIVEKGVINNYQIITPSTLNAAPRAPWGAPGPYEEAVLNTPILEKYNMYGWR